MSAADLKGVRLHHRSCIKDDQTTFGEMAQSLCQNLKLCVEKEKLPGIQKRPVKRKVHNTFGSRSGFFLPAKMVSKFLFHMKQMRTSQEEHGKMLLGVEAKLEEHSKLLLGVKENGNTLLEGKLMLENQDQILLELKAMQEEHSKMLPEVKATQEEHGKMLPEVKGMQEKHGKMLPEVKATQEEHGKMLLDVQATQEEHGKILQDVQATQEEHSKVLPTVRATQEENGKMLLDVKATQEEHGKVLPEVKATQEEIRKMTQEVQETLADKDKSDRIGFHAPIGHLQLCADGGNTIIINKAPDARQNLGDVVHLRPEDAAETSTSVLPLDVQATVEKDRTECTLESASESKDCQHEEDGLVDAAVAADHHDGHLNVPKPFALCEIDDGGFVSGLPVACSDANSQLAKGLKVQGNLNILKKRLPGEKSAGVPWMPKSVENKCEELVMIAIGSCGGGGGDECCSRVLLDAVPAAASIGWPDISQSASPVDSEQVCYGFEMKGGSPHVVLHDHAHNGSLKQWPEGAATFLSSVALSSDKPGSEGSCSASGPGSVEEGSLSATSQASKRMKGFRRSLSDSGSVKAGMGSGSAKAGMASGSVNAGIGFASVEAGSGSVKAGIGIKLPDMAHAWSDRKGIRGSLSTSYPDLMQIDRDKLRYEVSLCSSVDISEEADTVNGTQSDDNDIRSQSPSLAHASQTVSGIKESDEPFSTPVFEPEPSGDVIKSHVAALPDSVMTGIGVEERSHSASVSGVESGMDNLQVSESYMPVMSVQGHNDIKGPQSDSGQSDYDARETA